ncbi:hypothetical protein [Listeria booriae]|uniref:Uncharacterized protein n=1 Tax=Listeria booriae TaxID=1552123 RepID=A0A7X1CLQ9_9LIST|nr:hypothetical protein [Listeria booriae]MBC1793497.1 hypothetical protein [Listeria booriae]MBC1802835.1 hypothetical protein [Listeria booriae]
MQENLIWFQQQMKQRYQLSISIEEIGYETVTLVLEETAPEIAKSLQELQMTAHEISFLTMQYLQEDMEYTASISQHPETHENDLVIWQINGKVEAVMLWKAKGESQNATEI